MQPDCGALVVTTINRTVAALALAIVGAEYVARIVPAGTHEWAKFVRPSEIRDCLTPRGMLVTEWAGFAYNPLLGRWSSTDSLAVNYGMIARRRPPQSASVAEAPLA